MKKIALILGLALIVAINAGCGGDKNKMAARKWHITKFESPEMADMNADQKKQMQEMMKNASFEFKADGNTTMDMGEMKKSGKWKIDGDKLILTDETGKGDTNVIKKLTDNSFNIEGDANGKKVVVEMEPAK